MSAHLRFIIILKTLFLCKTLHMKAVTCQTQFTGALMFRTLRVLCCCFVSLRQDAREAPLECQKK